MNNICLSLNVEKWDELKNVELPSLVELRLDFLNPLNKKVVRKITKKLSNKKIILTYRKKFNGWSEEVKKRKNKEGDWKEILFSGLDYSSYLDIDFNSYLEKKNDYQELLEEARKKNIKIIYSQHPKEISSMSEILSELERMKKEGADICKYVPNAQGLDDNLKILKVNLKFNFPKILFCQGELGVTSRLMAPIYGSKWTYSCLRKRTAPGQLSFEKTQKIISWLRA